MKHLITLMSLAVGVGFAATADNYTMEYKTRDNAAKAPRVQVLSVTKASDNTGNAPAARAAVTRKAEDYGTLTPIISEDFSKMTKGAEGDPYMELDLYDPKLDQIKGNVWQSMRPGYTKTKDWGCHNVYQAGGMIYMYSWPTEYIEGSIEAGLPQVKVEGQQSQINPTLFDNTAYDPFVVVRFRARAAEPGKPVKLLIEGAETNGMGPNWDIFNSTGVEINSTEWHEVSAIIPGGGKSVIASIVSMENSLYLDDFEVCGLTQYVGTPVPLPHSDYQGTSFVANWTEAHDAESYLLTVTYYNDETGTYEPILDHVNVGNKTSFRVEDVISGVDYYYSVAAVKGAYTSIESAEMEVHDVERPAALGKVHVAENGTYSVSWPEVPSAERYNYMNYYKRIADKAGEFVIFEDNFDNIVDFEGEPGVVGFDALGEINGAYPGPYFINGLSMGAWEAYSYYVGDGFLGICSFFLTQNGEPSQLESPALDLSQDGGKFKLSIDLGSHDGRWPAQGIGPGIHELPQAVIAVAHWDDEAGDYVPTHQYWTRNRTSYDTDENGGVKQIFLNDPIPYGWKHYDLELEGGAERTKIIIFALGGMDWVTVDNMKISQIWPAGHSYLHPIEYKQYIEGTEVEVQLPGLSQGTEIYHHLEAVKARVVSGGMGGDQVSFTNSGFGELSLADVLEHNVAGIESVTVDSEASVRIDGSVLHIDNAAGEAVAVYAANGALMARGNGSMSVALSQRGVYLVKVGDSVIKVVY